MTLVQVAAFVGQEFLERLASSSPLGGLVHDHVLATGVVVQVAVALIGAAALRMLARASARIAANGGIARVTPLRPAIAAALPMATDTPSGRIASFARNVRAPPSA